VVQVYVDGTVVKGSNARSAYHGSSVFGASRNIPALVLAVAMAGCSMSFPSLLGEKDGDKNPPSTSAENPTTGARGTVTPVAQIYEKDGFPCRNFILGGVRDGRESWFEGTACRIHRGNWDVMTTRPLQKS
jgi:hypothetical protein